MKMETEKVRERISNIEQRKMVAKRHLGEELDVLTVRKMQKLEKEAKQKAEDEEDENEVKAGRRTPLDFEEQ